MPDYVDPDRTPLNSVIVPYLAAPEVREASLANRGVKRRAIKSDAATSTDIIITFGKGAQDLFDALPVEAQDAAYRAVAERVTRELGLPLTGLAAHRDESAPHAHGQTLAYLPDGRAVSNAIRAAERAKIQTWAGEEIARHVPGIVRGKSKVDRIKDGEPRHKTRNRRVKELHQDLPEQIEDKRRDLDQLVEREAEMKKRVADLEAKTALTAAEAKRLEVYRARLEQRTRALAAVTRKHIEDKLEAEIREEMEAKVAEDLKARKAALQAKEKRLRTVADDMMELVRRVRGVLGILARVLSVKLTNRINADLQHIEEAAAAYDFGPEDEDDHREGFRM